MFIQIAWVPCERGCTPGYELSPVEGRNNGLKTAQQNLHIIYKYYMVKNAFCVTGKATNAEFE